MSKKGKCFDVRYGRSDVVVTVFAKDETDAWNIASDLLDEDYKEEHDFFAVDCERSFLEESDCQNYEESEDE